MGIFDDFINSVKSQRARYKAAQQRAKDEQALKKTGATQKEAEGEGWPGVTAVQEQEAREVVEQFGHVFVREAGLSPNIWLDDAGRAVYIDDADAYLKSGGKVEVKGITSAMDPYMYDIFTSQGGPLVQAKYYRQDNVVVSLVPDPFARYRK